jgi:tRNA-specific 2-thiouridylase
MLAQGPALFRAADTARDQSYFLFATTADQLARLDFPLGGLTKPAVRDLAQEIGLPVAAKPDSQDICFVAGGRYADLVARMRPEAVTAGDIVHVDGRVLGRHEGVIHFTVGQRKGLGVASAEPLYVVRLEPETARVVVGPRASLAVETITLRDVNWLGDMPVDAIGTTGMDVHVRVRSTQALRPAILMPGEPGTLQVHLPGGELGVARGQACVVYADGSDRARVLGGGFIAAAERRGSAGVV